MEIIMDLKINEAKMLEFNAVIEGGDTDDLSGKVRITINDIEYGFPVKFEGKKIQVKIPPLKEYVRESKLRAAKTAEVKLDVIAKGKLFTPWKDTVNLEIPLEVKAEMTDIKSFLDEADKIIKVSKVDEVNVVEKENEPELDEKKKDKKIKDDENRVVKEKIKSRFSIMLGDE
jgi:hypothetical protein